MPVAEQRRLRIGDAFALRRFRWIGWLDFVGTALTILATGWVLVFGFRFDRHLPSPACFRS